MKYNIAIDGPAGAGKSTIAKKLAKDLGYIYVDTGAMYRAMAYYFLMNNIKSDDVEMISKACQNVEISIVYKDGEQQVIFKRRKYQCIYQGRKSWKHGFGYKCLSGCKGKTCGTPAAACKA